MFISKMPSITCVHTLYNNKNININTKACCKKFQFYMCTYILLQHKHKHNGSMPNFPVSNVYTPSLHVVLPSTKTQTITRKILVNISSLTFVNTIYNNPIMNNKFICQNFQSWIYTYPLQQHKYKFKVSFAKIPNLTYVRTLYNNTKIVQTIIYRLPVHTCDMYKKV